MMATIDIKNLDGKSVGKVDLDDSVFGVEVNEHLLWEVVKAQRAKRRVGTHSTKRRDEVRGGGKKPFKQKGTGNARQGSTRAPHFVGGGKVFTPKPRDYEYHVPKKVMAGALRSALSLRAKEDKLVVVESFTLDLPKTKLVVKAIQALGGGKALLVDGKNESLKKSTRNLPKAKYVATEGLNVYDVLDHERLIMTRATLDAVTARLKNERAAEEGAA
jgi:large subunit ribosomal protein L4